jgi:hypothetical protein
MKRLLEKLGKEAQQSEPKKGNTVNPNADSLKVCVFIYFKTILREYKKENIPEELFNDLLRWKDGSI